MNKHNTNEEIDSYSQEGLVIFTATYLLKRGYCCGNGCKHCPYEYKNVTDETRKKQLQERAKNRENI